MPMNDKHLNEVAKLAKEVEKLAREVKAEQPGPWRYGTATTGALRRRSMDLTRALADLRRS